MVTDVEVSALEVERSVFNSHEVEILSTAFKKAWPLVEFDPLLSALAAAERQSELVRRLMVFLKLGNTDPVSIANLGIAHLRKTMAREADFADQYLPGRISERRVGKGA